MFPEPTSIKGKRLVPQLAVGCVVFAIVGLLGTFLVAKVGSSFLHPDRAQLAQQAAAREAGKR